MLTTSLLPLIVVAAAIPAIRQDAPGALGRWPFRLAHALVGDPLIARILRNASIIFSGNTAASALNLVSFALMARRTGAAALAIFALTQNYVQILNEIFNIQTWEALVTFAASGKRSPRTISILKTNCYIDVSSAAVGTLVALALMGTASRHFGWAAAPMGTVALYCLTILFNLTSLTIGIPRLYNRFGAVARIQVVVAMLRLAGVGALFLFSCRSIGSYMLVYLLGEVGTNLAVIVLALALLRSDFGPGWWKAPASRDKDVLRFIWWTNLRTVARIPVRYFDMPIIASVMSLQMVGAYRVYKEIAGIISRVGDPVNQAVFPEFARLLNSGDRKRAMQTGRKSVLLMALASIGIVVPMVVASRFVVARFFGPSYLGWIPALQLLIVVYGIGFASLPVNALFIAAGFARASFWVVTFTNVIYLGMAYVLGSTVGIYGLIAAYAAQSLLNSGIKVLLLVRQHRSAGVPDGGG